MNAWQENIFLISAVMGFLLGLALMTHLFRPHKANAFLGLIVLLTSLQLLFSWGSLSNYNNTPGAFPFWIFLSYYVLAPSIWLYTKCTLDAIFRLKRWHVLLFVPALIEVLIHTAAKWSMLPVGINLMDFAAWNWYVDYLPMIGFVVSLAFFWTNFFQVSQYAGFNGAETAWMPRLKVILFMGTLSLIGVLWVVFTFVDWGLYSIVEFLLVSLLLVFSFMIFMENQSQSWLEKNNSMSDQFSHFDDQRQLRRLDQALTGQELFTRPSLSLKELAKELDLPARYISYLINRYHRINFKRLINDYRIEAFIAKARSPEEKHKTLLALALESGFNSKSTFNQAFKTHKGKSPSEFLRSQGSFV